jgi:hypothetical protein
VAAWGHPCGDGDGKAGWAVTGRTGIELFSFLLVTSVFFFSSSPHLVSFFSGLSSLISFLFLVAAMAGLSDLMAA